METQVDVLPEVKEVGVNLFEIIEVPESRVDDFITSEGRRCKIDEGVKAIGLIYQKISYLRGILNYSKDTQDYVLSGDLEKYIRTAEEVFVANENRLPEYINAQLVENLIRKEIPTIRQINVDEKGSTRDEKIKNALDTDFKETSGSKVCISQSHGATWFELKAAYEAKKNETTKIAVIVFDNHVDIYRSCFDPMISKGNIFRLLGDNGIIERVTFIGGLDEEIMITKENSISKKEGKTVRYEQIGIDELKSDKVTDRTLLLRRLEETIERYKKIGITNIVFSVDMDVLKASEMGYTGFEYSPIKPLNNVSSLNLPLDKAPSELTQTDIDHIESAIKYESWFRNQNYYNPRGLALGDIAVSLDAISEYCKKYGLNFGIKLFGGGTYFGDLVEMSGPDYKGRTAKASVALLRRIERIVQNQ